MSGGGCGGSKAYGITSCADAPAATGSYRYRVVAVYATWTAISAVSGPVALLVDTTAPTVISIARVGASPTNATTGGWTVTFSESVTGVGAADFALARTGGVTGGAITAVTGSGTTYSVTATTGSGDGTLGLSLVDDDSITDVAANPVGGTGAGNGSFTGQSYAIDKTGPIASSVARAAASPTNATSVSWTVTFTEAVTGVGTADFALAATGPSGAAITGVQRQRTSYTVTSSTGTGNGTLGLNLVDDDTITDALANPLGGSGAGNGNLTGSDLHDRQDLSRRAVVARGSQRRRVVLAAGLHRCHVRHPLHQRHGDERLGVNGRHHGECRRGRPHGHLLGRRTAQRTSPPRSPRAPPRSARRRISARSPRARSR